MQEQNEHLELKLSSLKSDLQSAHQLNTSLSFELQNCSRAREEKYESMEISELMIINKHLKDRNDELILQLQSITATEDDQIEDHKDYNVIGEAFMQPLSDLLSCSNQESLKQECKKIIKEMCIYCILHCILALFSVHLPSPEMSPSGSINSSSGKNVLTFPHLTSFFSFFVSHFSKKYLNSYFCSGFHFNNRS